MSDKFEKFSSTNLYVNFGYILDVNTVVITDNNYKKYVEGLDSLRISFLCYNTPTYKKIVKYISSFENIPENDIVEFSLLVTLIFKRFMYFITSIEKLHKKTTTKLRKEDINNLVKEKITKSNNEVLTCECGMEHVRTFTYNHTQSIEHRYRMDGINYYKNNNHIQTVTNSAHTDDICLDSDI